MRDEVRDDRRPGLLDRLRGDETHEADDVEVVRSEEELAIRHDTFEAGRVRVHKRIVSEPFTTEESRGIEHAVLERVPAHEDDDGEVITLEDGSVSIPVLEEEVVVTKRVFVRERLVIRKQTEHEAVTLEGELRREEVDVDVDDAIAGRVSDQRGDREDSATL